MVYLLSVIRMSLRKIIFLVVVWCVCGEKEEMEKKTALVFGGNGFIGSESVVALLNRDFEVTCVNRGNWYWDSETRIKPRVKNIKCDRNLGLENCVEFIDHVSTLQQKPWSVVVDFSAYKPEVVENTLQILKKHIEFYIFISSDSVYEVCELKNHTGGSKEDDAIRPPSLEKRIELNQRDSYGHRKLACEEVIKRQLEEAGIPFVILRLADVIGPRDTTNRWWVYQLWIEFYHQINKPLIIPPQLYSLKTSYVYVKDVGVIIEKIVSEKEKVKNEVFNVGLDESLTLSQLLTDMALNLHVNQVHLAHSSDPSSFFLFPSVTRGSVDNSKIKSRLGWSPTSWNDVLSETTKFYKSAVKYFPNEKRDAVDTLLEYIIPEEHKPIFLNALDAAERGITSIESQTSENTKTEL